MRVTAYAILTTTLTLVAACGPTAEQQAAMTAAQHADDQKKCAGFGFQPSTDAFANCMMTTASRRDAQQAADHRAAAAQSAATDRQNAAIKAQKEAEEKDAWDRRTHQGAYANSPSNGSADTPARYPASAPSSNPVDAVRDSIQDDLDKIDHAGTLSQ